MVEGVVVGVVLVVVGVLVLGVEKEVEDFHPEASLSSRGRM